MKIFCSCLPLRQKDMDMNLHPFDNKPRSLRNTILLAGFAGGITEILWVALYSIFAHASGSEIAEQVTESLLPSLILSAFSVPAGIAIHLVLSLILGTLFSTMIWLPYVRQHGTIATLVAAIVVLTGVWVVNFLIILPVLNPAFVTLMPYWVTLLSKCLFGIAMVWVLNGFPHTYIPRIIVSRWIA